MCCKCARYISLISIEHPRKGLSYFDNKEWKSYKEVYIKDLKALMRLIGTKGSDQLKMMMKGLSERWCNDEEKVVNFNT